MRSVLVNLIVLRSSDVSATVAFYELLGLTFVAEKHGSGPDHFAAHAGDVVLEIYPAQQTEELIRGGLADTRLGLSVPDLDGAVDRATKAGALVSPVKDRERGRPFAVVADPDGRKVELTQRGYRPPDRPSYLDEDTDFDDFICTCSEEGTARADEVMAIARQHITDLWPGLMVDSSFTSLAVRYLEAQFKASVVGIGSDLWFGIWTQADDGSFLTFIQCDELEHGLAATLNAFKDNADGVLVHPPMSDGS